MISLLYGRTSKCQCSGACNCLLQGQYPASSSACVSRLFAERVREFLRSWRVGELDVSNSHTYQLVLELLGRQLCIKVWSTFPTVQAPTRHWSAGVRFANDCDSGFWQFALKPVPKARSCEKSSPKGTSSQSGVQEQERLPDILLSKTQDRCLCARVCGI